MKERDYKSINKDGIDIIKFSLSEVIGHTVRYVNGEVLKVCAGNEAGLLHDYNGSICGCGRLENIVEILDGLKPGDVVISEGQARLHPEIAVKIFEGQSSSSAI